MNHEALIYCNHQGCKEYDTLKVPVEALVPVEEAGNVLMDFGEKAEKHFLAKGWTENNGLHYCPMHSRIASN